VQPVAEPDGMPVENREFKKRPAEQHHEPVAVERRAFTGRGNVVKAAHAMAKAAPERLDAIAQDQPEFFQPYFADVLQRLRNAAIDVMTLDGEFGPCVVFVRMPIATQTVEHQFHHVTLPMMRRRGVGKNENLHSCETVGKQGWLARDKLPRMGSVCGIPRWIPRDAGAFVNPAGEQS